LSDVGQIDLARHGKFRFERLLRKKLEFAESTAALPKTWRFVKEIPKDGMGKRKVDLLDALFDGPSSEISTRDPEIHSESWSGDQATINLRLPNGLSWFDGHFPQSPILPGIVQLHWVCELFYRHFGDRYLLGRKLRVKFRQVITPGTSLDLALRLNARGDSLEFEYRSAAGTHASGAYQVVKI
jgi:hypothetical protein